MQEELRIVISARSILRPIPFNSAAPISIFKHITHPATSANASVPTAMSSNVGLNTPRGSGTSGFVQRNSANLKPRDNNQPYPKDIDSIQYRQRQPDKEILEHDRKRDIEVKVFALRDKLEDEGYDTQHL
jgi:hypothetical protein